MVFFIKVVQFTDTHFGESAEKDQDTEQVLFLIKNKIGLLRIVTYQKVMYTVLDAEAPVDLVWISGDWVAGYSWENTDGGALINLGYLILQGCSAVSV